MTIETITRNREIREVLHFTTHLGLLGALHSRAVKSRMRLPADVDLEFIYKPNASYRKDFQWLDYVSLSISRINNEFFKSSCRWHRLADLWWCIMSFDPVVLGHEGVYFATTNNIYTGVIREQGPDGLARLFEERVVRWNRNVVVRADELPRSFPTCSQAEVLYPGELSVKYLRRVYVRDEEDHDEVFAQLNVVNMNTVEVVVDASKFE